MTDTAAVDSASLEHRLLVALRECYDLEVPVNVVDLGLVHEARVRGGKAIVRITMTTRNSPSIEWLKSEVRRRAEAIEGIDRAIVDIVWEPPWTPDRMTEAARAKLGPTSRE